MFSVVNVLMVHVGGLCGERAGPQRGRAHRGAGAGEAGLLGPAGYHLLLRQAA